MNKKLFWSKNVIEVAKKLSPLKLFLVNILLETYSEVKQGGQNMHSYKTNAVMNYSGERECIL